jgi:hypothetical protein
MIRHGSYWFFLLRLDMYHVHFFYIVCIGVEVCCVWNHTGLLDR